MVLWKGSKLYGGSQKRTGEDTSSAEDIGSQGHQNIELTHHDARSEHISEDNVLQEQLHANVSETTDFTSDKELPSEHEGQVDCNANTRKAPDIDNVLEEPEEAMVMNDDQSRDQVKKHSVSKESLDMNAMAVMGSEEAVVEFHRLWQEAINSNEVVMLEKSEGGLDSVLEKVKSHNRDSQRWDCTSNSWEEKLDERLGLIQGAACKVGRVYLYANQQGCDGGRIYYGPRSLCSLLEC